MTDWIGGKPSGCISLQERWCQVVFSKLPSKCFSYSNFTSKEQAIAAAKKYQLEISNKHNLTKNRYRIITDNQYKYLEVQLQNNLIMKCEVEHLPIVEERIWTANKGSQKYTYYVKSRESKKRKQDHILFHNRAYPEFTQIDHINRDGLDNRKSNIREGGGRVNPNNKRIQKNNVSGVKGVYKEEGDKARWIAQWVDVDGKKRKKSWSIKKYGDEEAFKYACDYRKEQQDIVNKHIEKEYSRIVETDNDGYKKVYHPDGSIIVYPPNPANLIVEE